MPHRRTKYLSTYSSVNDGKNLETRTKLGVPVCQGRGDVSCTCMPWNALPSTQRHWLRHFVRSIIETILHGSSFGGTSVVGS